jgi:hypothetical protein
MLFIETEMAEIADLLSGRILDWLFLNLHFSSSPEIIDLGY